MTNDKLPQTYGTLKDDTPFNEIFPDKQVPIVSLIPRVPAQDAPQCYVIDPLFLTKEQVTELAKLIEERWKPECTSLEMAIQAVKTGMNIRCEHFSGVSTTSFREFMKFAD